MMAIHDKVPDPDRVDGAICDADQCSWQLFMPTFLPRSRLERRPDCRRSD